MPAAEDPPACSEILGGGLLVRAGPARRLREEMAIVRDVSEKIDLPLVRFADNLTAPAIRRACFERNCMPFYQELSDMLAGRNVPIFSYMDGDLMALGDLIAECGLDGIESFTPAPTGDTSVRDALRLWPDKILLLNFPSSVHIEPPEAVRRHADEILQVLGAARKLQIQISENVPAWAWRDSLPQIVAAIEDFGPPGG